MFEISEKTLKSMDNNMLRFDKETHRYYLGDKRIPGVNHILEYAGVKKPLTFINDNIRRGMDRGERTHKKCVGYAEWPETFEKYTKVFIDHFVQITESEDIRQYVVSFTDWWRDYVPELIQAETPQALTAEGLQFAGIPDMLNKLKNKIVLEIKTGQKAGWHRKQLAGYGLLNPGYDLALLYLNEGYEYIPIEKDEQVVLEAEFAGYVKKYWQENIWCL